MDHGLNRRVMCLAVWVCSAVSGQVSPAPAVRPAPAMLGEARNAAAQDQPASIGNLDDARPASKNIQGDQDAVMEDAKNFLFDRSIRRNAENGSKGEKIDLFDARTGMPLDALDAIKDMASDDTLVTGDEFGPFGPGRRERLGRMAGLTEQEARELWPMDEPGPVKNSDLVKAAEVIAKGGGSMEEALSKLAPDQSKERLQALRNTVLTDAESSFAVYAALGFPFPIRIGRVQNPPPNGFIIFNPQLLRVDLTNEAFKARHITYRWMEGREEVYHAEVDVTTYLHLPRPTAPVTHVLISSDDDVMAYALVGRMPPSGLWEVRSTLMKEVVDMYSHLRPTVKLYGLRWSLMPGINELMDNPQTKAKMTSIMEDLGFIKNGQVPNIKPKAIALKQDDFTGGDE